MYVISSRKAGNHPHHADFDKALDNALEAYEKARKKKRKGGSGPVVLKVTPYVKAYFQSPGWIGEYIVKLDTLTADECEELVQQGILTEEDCQRMAGGDPD